MNYAIKINTLVNSLWPDHHSQPNHLLSQQNLYQVDLFLQSLSLNEFHQIIELCTQKTLFILLQKSNVIIKKHIEDKAQLLKQMDLFFRNWVMPQYPYNLKRSYDVNCLQNYFESSIGEVMGKILKEISKSNTQSDWELLSRFLTNLGEKSNFYQILIIEGYFSEMQSLQEDLQQFEYVRQILKNFEYEVIPKVMQIVIRNISFCKQTLEVAQIEAMSNNLSLMNQDTNMDKNKILEVYIHESINQSKIKYLKMNFQILRKVVDFNYHIEFQSTEGQHINQIGISREQEKSIRNSFPEYMIRLFLETGLIESVYGVAEILTGFKLPVKDVGLRFAQIVLDLINKIIRTKIQELHIQLKEMFIKDVLLGQCMLMRKLSDKMNIRESLMIKVIRGNTKVLKNLSLKNILLTNQGRQWTILTLNIIEMIMTGNSQIDTENYLIYKTVSLIKQLVYQTTIYEIISISQPLAKDIFILGLKVQEIYFHSFVNSSKLMDTNKYYNIEDLKIKRDRHFHILKPLSQIHLPQFNNLLQSLLSSLKSGSSAINYLLKASYFISPQSINCFSYFHKCYNEDVTTFKKLTIGNGLILMQQLLKQGTQQIVINENFEDAVFLYIEKLLQLYFQNEIPIAMTFSCTDTPLPIDQSICQLLSNKPKLLTSLFLDILKIIHIKIKKQPHFSDKDVFSYYFKKFIKYLTLLINQNQLLHTFEIISIQCELIQHFIEFKTYLRNHLKFQQRKYLSEITFLLNHEPQTPQKSQKYKNKMTILFYSEIQELLKLLNQYPNDWIGICYEIGGFLQLIAQEKTYFKAITLIGHQFLNKIFMSCLDNANFQKIKLMAYFFESFINFTQDQKVKNLTFWLQFVKPIFFSWIQLFKILQSPKSREEMWDEICYPTLKTFLQNENLNFFMLKRSSIFKNIIEDFTSELILYINLTLQKNLLSKDTNLFKVMRVIFRSLSDYYLQDKNDNIGKSFLKLAQNLMHSVKEKFCFINKGKCQNLIQSIEVLKALQVILQYFSQTCAKYSYKIILIQKIQQFVMQNKVILRDVQNQLYKFTVNYEKYIKFSSQKYRKSEIDLLINTSKIICQLCDIQRSSKSQKVNQQNTMSDSEQERSNQIKNQKKHEQMLIESINSLEKQFIWFDIQGKKEIIDY